MSNMVDQGGFQNDANLVTSNANLSLLYLYLRVLEYYYVIQDRMYLIVLQDLYHYKDQNPMALGRGTITLVCPFF